MLRIACSTAALPGELDERARFHLWRDLYMAEHGRLEFTRADALPCLLGFEFAQYGEIGVGRFDGAFDHITRSASRIAAKPSDTFCLVFNRGLSRVACTYRQRDIDLDGGEMVLFCDIEAADLWGPQAKQLVFIPIPGYLLSSMVADVDDVAGKPIPVNSPAARHLTRYLDLLDDDISEADDRLTAHVEATLLDLVSLALDARGEAYELARSRGLRMARLRDAVTRIRAGFRDPDFSAQQVALGLGLSTRYVQDLLHENGRSFTARILDLRLQHARKMLADARHDRLRVSEIAFASGFNDVSYFNRCYRRRFGASPLDHRHGARGIIGLAAE